MHDAAFTAQKRLLQHQYLQEVHAVPAHGQLKRLPAHGGDRRQKEEAAEKEVAGIVQPVFHDLFYM